MLRSTGPVRTLLLMLGAGGTGLLLGLGAVSVASALDGGQVQELGEPVVFDPTAITPTAVTTPAPTSPPDAVPAPQLGTSTEPQQVAPAAPRAVDDDGDDDDDDDDDDLDDD